MMTNTSTVSSTWHMQLGSIETDTAVHVLIDVANRHALLLDLTITGCGSTE
jgi:hypothetical protein